MEDIEIPLSKNEEEEKIEFLKNRKFIYLN